MSISDAVNDPMNASSARHLLPELRHIQWADGRSPPSFAATMTRSELLRVYDQTDGDTRRARLVALGDALEAIRDAVTRRLHAGLLSDEAIAVFCAAFSDERSSSSRLGDRVRDALATTLTHLTRLGSGRG